MDQTEAEIALGEIATYWPGRGLSDHQLFVWGASIVKTRCTFDRACEILAELAATNAQPPSLSDLCGYLRPPTRPELQPVETEPHAPTTERGRAWAAHTARLGRRIGTRLDDHDHHAGWQNCPVCSATASSQCGEPTCPICAPTPSTTVNPSERPTRTLSNR